MNIAYLLADHGIPVFGDKGASIHVRDFAGALRDAGHEVTLLCAKQGPVSGEPSFVLRKIRPQAALEAPVDEEDPLAPRRAKENRYMATARAMEAAVIEHHAKCPFDFIYERYSLWSDAGVRAGRRLKIPVVVEVNAPLVEEQGTYRQLAQPEKARAIETSVFREADALVTVSRAMARHVVAKGADPKRVHVVPNGVNPAQFNPKQTPHALPEAEGRLVIAFAGSLKAWHGVDLLLDAFKELTGRLTGLHLLVLGDGPMMAWLRGYARGAGLENRITFTGWLPHDQVPRHLARADVAVAPYPHLENFYFSPLKLFEYMALGKAIVASDIGQIRELIQHGETGLLVPAGDTVTLVDAIEALLLDAETRNRLGANAARASRRFTWQANAERLMEIVQPLIRKPTGKKAVK